MEQPVSADAALVGAAKLKAEGRLADAAALLLDALTKDGRAHAVCFQLALFEVEQGHWIEAENFCRFAVSTGGDRYASGLGQILANVAKYEEAEIWLRRASTWNPMDAMAYAILGHVIGAQRRFDEALFCIDQALAIQPDLPVALFYREHMRAEQQFFAHVGAALDNLIREQGIDLDSDAAGDAEIQIPSASLDENGIPRFRMWMPASLILNDLGAAHLFFQEISSGGYERRLRRFLDFHLASDDVFIDVGAHWGVHSLTAATCLRRQISVLAIEAHPANSARLGNWVERNELGADVEVISSALGDREGHAQLRVNGSSMGHSLRPGIDAGVTAIEVRVSTLDHLLVDRPHLRWRRVFLKIDVEGCELEVLSGARRLLSSGAVAAIVWEKGAFQEPDVQNQKARAIFEMLDSYGFEHFYMAAEDRGFRLLPLRDKELMLDVFSLASSLDRVERYG